VEVASQMRHELSVGRMVGRFDADDLRGERLIVLLDEAEKAELRLGGTDEKNLAVSRERARDLAEVPVLIVGMAPDTQVDLIGVTVNVRAGRIDERVRELVGVDLEDPCLFLIDPYDCVLHGERSLKKV
jgi:hypothetical protein